MPLSNEARDWVLSKLFPPTFQVSISPSIMRASLTIARVYSVNIADEARDHRRLTARTRPWHGNTPFPIRRNEYFTRGRSSIVPRWPDSGEHAQSLSSFVRNNGLFSQRPTLVFIAPAIKSAQQIALSLTHYLPSNYFVNSKSLPTLTKDFLTDLSALIEISIVSK